jgi:hypothetical protein
MSPKGVMVTIRGGGELLLLLVLDHLARFDLDYPHSIAFSGGACHRSAKASGGEDLEIEQPVSCWDCSSLDFHTALPSMLGTPLVGDQVVEMREPSQKRLLIPFAMMETFHHA